MTPCVSCPFGYPPDILLGPIQASSATSSPRAYPRQATVACEGDSLWKESLWLNSMPEGSHSLWEDRQGGKCFAVDVLGCENRNYLADKLRDRHNVAFLGV
jgi:hypothetical protein